MKYPLVALAIIFSFGIFAASYLDVSFTSLYLLTFLFLIASIIFIKKNAKFNIFIFGLIFLVGALLLKNSQALPLNHISRVTPYKGEDVSVIGIVDSDPAYKEKSVSFVVSITKLKHNQAWYDVCGRVLVRVFSVKNAGESAFLYGDKLALKGKLFRPFAFLKGFDYAGYLERQGIYSILNVGKGGGRPELLGKTIRNPVKYFAFKARHKIKTVFTENLSPLSSGIMNAIMLGDRQNLPRGVRDDLMKSGSVHIIAISGLHLGIVAFMTLVALKIMRIPRKPRYAVAIIILIAYCFLTGARTPVTRATIMAVILLLGYIVGRRPSIYNSLALAAIVILAIDPCQLFDVSFQLSFSSVISIIWLTPRIKNMFPQKMLKVRGVRFLILTFSVSSAAWLGLLPLIAYYFQMLTPVTVLANMIIVPSMPLIVASGLALASAGFLWPALASLIAGSVELFLLILLKVNSLLISIPGAYSKIARPSVKHILIYYSLLILILSIHGKKPFGLANRFKGYLQRIGIIR